MAAYKKYHTKRSKSLKLKDSFSTLRQICCSCTTYLEEVATICANIDLVHETLDHTSTTHTHELANSRANVLWLHHYTFVGEQRQIRSWLKIKSTTFGVKFDGRPSKWNHNLLVWKSGMFLRERRSWLSLSSFASTIFLGVCDC